MINRVRKLTFADVICFVVFVACLALLYYGILVDGAGGP